MTLNETSEARWVTLKDFFKFNVIHLAGGLSKSALETGKRFIFLHTGKSSRIRQHAAWTVVYLSATTAARWET